MVTSVVIACCCYVGALGPKTSALRSLLKSRVASGSRNRPAEGLPCAPCVYFLEADGCTCCLQRSGKSNLWQKNACAEDRRLRQPATGARKRGPRCRTMRATWWTSVRANPRRPAPFPARPAAPHRASPLTAPRALLHPPRGSGSWRGRGGAAFSGRGGSAFSAGGVGWGDTR